MEILRRKKEKESRNNYSVRKKIKEKKKPKQPGRCGEIKLHDARQAEQERRRGATQKSLNQLLKVRPVFDQQPCTRI